MHLKLPAPATVLASIALLVSLTGTAVAAGAVPLAKKAMFASNAGKLQGRTATQIAATPGPANSVAGLLSRVTVPFSLAAGDSGDFSASCPAGSRVISGGYSYSGDGFVMNSDTRATTDSTWAVYLFNADDSGTATGLVSALCLR